MERWSGELESGWRGSDAEVSAGHKGGRFRRSRILKSQSELLHIVLLVFNHTILFLTKPN